MRRYNTEAIVLKSIRYKDADKIFTLLTKDNGTVSAIARGVRKISSRRAGNLDTLNYIHIKIHESDKGFKNIEEVKTLKSFKNIKKDLELSKKAFYMIELLHRNVENGHENRRVFKLLLVCLKLLSGSSKYNPNVVVIFFEINLLKELGYQLNLEKCVKCQKILGGKGIYTFNFDLGGFMCSNCSNTGLKVSKDLFLDIKKIWRGNLKLNNKLKIEEIKFLLRSYIDDKLENKFKSLEI